MGRSLRDTLRVAKQSDEATRQTQKEKIINKEPNETPNPFIINPPGSDLLHQPETTQPQKSFVIQGY